MFAGAVHVTCRLVSDKESTVGAKGVEGGSATSVTVTTMILLTLFARPSVPPVAVTSTMYSLLPAVFAGNSLPWSVGFSKFGAMLKCNTPVYEMLNVPLSAPLSE